MNPRFRSRRNNPLIQRVLRHVSTSVLFGRVIFRFPAAPDAGSSLSGEQAAPAYGRFGDGTGRPLVMASLMPASALPQEPETLSQMPEQEPIEGQAGLQEPRRSESPASPDIASRIVEAARAAASRLTRGRAPSPAGKPAARIPDARIQPARSLPAPIAPKPAPAVPPPVRTGSASPAPALNLPPIPVQVPPQAPARPVTTSPIPPLQAVPPAATPLQRKPEPAAQPPKAGPAPAASEPEESEDDKRNWQRLETIFHRHEEKRIMEEAAQATAESEPPPAQPAAPVQRQPLAQPAREIDRSEGAVQSPPSQPAAGPAREKAGLPESGPSTALPGSPAKTPTRRAATEELKPVQAGPVTPPPPRPAIIEEEPSSSKPPVQSTQPGPSRPLPAKPVEPPAPGESLSEEPAGPSPQAAQSAPTQVARKPAPGPAGEAHLPPQPGPTGPAAPLRPLPPQAVEPSGLPPELIAPETETPPEYIEPESSPSEENLQPLPLEAVWPVESVRPSQPPSEPMRSRRAPVAKAEPPASSPQPPSEAPSETGAENFPPALNQARTAETIQTKAAETQAVQNALQNVTPGQPTDSKVELITPRRPRPLPASPATPSGVTQERPAVQRKESTEAPPSSEAASPGGEGQTQPSELPLSDQGELPSPGEASLFREKGPPGDLNSPVEMAIKAAESPRVEPAAPGKPGLGRIQPEPPETPATVIRRQVEDKGATHTSVQKAELLPTRKVEAQSINLMPSQQSPAAPPEAFESEMVETSIGPLPSDLWSLIGERPPARAEKREPAAVEPSPAAPRAVQTSPSKAEPAREEGYLFPEEDTSMATPEIVRPASRRTPGSIPAAIGRAERGTGVTIQRAEAVDMVERPNLPIEGEGGGVQPAQLGGGGIDMDELTAKVYSEVKRRLSMEWERLRRRM